MTKCDLILWKKFKVFPEKKGNKAFYDVLIFRHKDAMLKYHHLQAKERSTRYFNKFNALCSGWTELKIGKTGNVKKADRCGEILFYKDSIGAGTVSHEMTHAAVYYLGAKKFKFGKLKTSGREDEKLATIQGELVRQFWNQYYQKRSL